MAEYGGQYTITHGDYKRLDWCAEKKDFLRMVVPPITTVHCTHSDTFTGAIACGFSCFGTSSLTEGFMISPRETEESLIENGEYRNTSFPNAGVICRKHHRKIHCAFYSRNTYFSQVINLAIPNFSAVKSGAAVEVADEDVNEDNDDDDNADDDDVNAEDKNNADDEDDDDAMVFCPPPTIAAGLGVVATILFLIVMGVVTGWVWSCHRKKAPKQL